MRYLPNIFAYILPFLGPLIIILLILMHMMHICPCIFNLLSKFVPSRLQHFYIKMMVMQGFQPIFTMDSPADIPMKPGDQMARKFHSHTRRGQCP